MALISAALGLPVEPWDDGSTNGMHDLEIRRADGPSDAVEVVAAADGECMALWKLMNGGGNRWQVPDLRGGWVVSLDPSARAKRLRRELPELLLALEGRGVRDIGYGFHNEQAVEAIAENLGVISAHQGETAFPGSIYSTIEQSAERTGGCVADTGDALAGWIGGFLREPEQADVLDKLARSGASARHAYVILPPFSTAPFAVSDLLMRSEAPLPTVRPVLPSSVTHIWVAGTWSSGDGFRWSPESQWTKFRTSRVQR